MPTVRRTVTTTTTETWTIVWVPDDESERQSSTTMQRERHGRGTAVHAAVPHHGISPLLLPKRTR